MIFYEFNIWIFVLNLQKISAEIAKPKTVKVVSSRPSQKSILAGIVRKRKASSSPDESNDQPKKPSLNESTNVNDSSEKDAKIASDDEKISSSAKQIDKEEGNAIKISPAKAPIVVSDLSEYDEGALKCIGILPGIGKYRESSDSEKSTDTDDEYDFVDFDWMGRRKMKKDGEDGECH